MDSSASITLDDSRWPLLVARFVGVPSLQQQDEYFRQLRTYLRGKEKFVGILDTREVRMMTAEHRHNLVGFVRENDAQIRAQVLGCAAIITSPVMQLATSIVLHLIPMPFPYFNTASMSDAVGWATRRLEGSGPCGSHMHPHCTGDLLARGSPAVISRHIPGERPSGFAVPLAGGRAE